MGLPLIAVYLNDGTLTVNLGGTFENGNPSSFTTKFTRSNDIRRSNDRVFIYKYGRAIISDRAVDEFTDEEGVVISPDVDRIELEAYFKSLGMDKEAGDSVDLSNYYTKAQVDGLIAAQQAQINFILGVIGVEQLDTPTLTAGTPTQTSIPLTIGTVANATSYKIFRDGVEVYSGAAGLQTITGLTDGTSYTFTAQAFADGYAPSDAAEVVVSTLPAQQTQLAAPSPVASNITPSSITITWPAVPNATVYEVRRNNIPQTGVQGTTFVDSGLNPDTQYQYIVIAKAQGYIDSPQGIVSATTQAGGQPSFPNIWNDTNLWNDNLTWQEAA